MQDRPLINHYTFTKERLPIHERRPEAENFDLTMDQLRKQKQSQMKPEDSKSQEKQLQKSTNKTQGGFEVGRRSIDDLLQWGDDRRFKLANQRLKKFEGASFSFQPEIDQKSQRIVSEISRVPVENRLLVAGQKKEERIKELYNKLQGDLFKPDINLNSKQILKNRKQEDLVARDIGKTKNVNYFEALPRCALEKQNDGLYSARKTPQKKSHSRSRYTSPLKDRNSSKRHKERSKSATKYLTLQEQQDLSIQRFNQESLKKNTKIIPNYVSPYNRDMLDSGIPLKQIIDETRASKIKEKQSKRKEAKSKTKGISGSHSKSKIDSQAEEQPLEFTNKNFLQAMRQAFQQEVEHSHLYKAMPLKSRSNSRIKQLKSKGEKSKIQTPSKNTDSSQISKRSVSRSKSKDATPVLKTLQNIKANILLKEASPSKKENSGWDRSIKPKGKSPTKVEKPSPEKLDSKRQQSPKKKLSQHEKDQLYKKRLKMIGNTYMYQALENTKKSTSPEKGEKNAGANKPFKK